MNELFVVEEFEEFPVEIKDDVELLVKFDINLLKLPNIFFVLLDFPLVKLLLLPFNGFLEAVDKEVVENEFENELENDLRLVTGEEFEFPEEDAILLDDLL